MADKEETYSQIELLTLIAASSARAEAGVGAILHAVAELLAAQKGTNREDEFDVLAKAADERGGELLKNSLAKLLELRGNKPPYTGF